MGRGFHRFASMARLSPFLPVVGDGPVTFQPVYVQDIAGCGRAERQKCKSQTYELGGPQTYTFRELMDYLIKTLPTVDHAAAPCHQMVAGATVATGRPPTRSAKATKYDTIVPEGTNQRFRH